MADAPQGESAENAYIADRYDGLPVGPRTQYTFETQEGIPYDGTNQLARQLSPFVFRLIIPDVLNAISDAGVDVNLLGRASDSADNANVARSELGLKAVNGTVSGEQSLIDLRSIVSAGQQLRTTFGQEERAMLADLTTVADIAYQIEKMLQIPPLTLLVNPNDMTLNINSVQQFSNRSRYGHIFERWGEGQTTISFSGSTGAFCAGASSDSVFGTIGSEGGDIYGREPGADFGKFTTSSFGDAGNTLMQETSSPTGVQFASKRDSAAYQNFTSLFHFYLNNGYIFDQVGGSEAHLMIGAVAIDYDQMTYVGHIESFEYSYQQDQPHRIEWSMEFIVDQQYDHAEAPVVVLPESSPTPAPGSLTAAELAKEMAATPQKADLELVGKNHHEGARLGISGISFTEDDPSTKKDEEEFRFGGGETSYTPLQMLMPNQLLG